MNTMTKFWLTGLAALVAGSAVGAGAMWAAQKNVGRLEGEIERLEQREREARRTVEELTEQTQSSETTPAEAAAATEKPAESPTTGTNAEDGRHFCYIQTATWQGAKPQLVVDYAELLTGKAAAAAATAAGEESPPPNDYFISNKNKKLRTFSASSSTKVTMASTADGVEPQGYPMTFSAWFDAFSGMSGTFPAIKQVPYWITVKNGSIVKIEEQYLP